MRTVPAALQTHFDTRQTNLGLLISASVVVAGTTIWRRITNVADEVIVGGNTYFGENGPVLTAMTLYSDGTPGTIEVDFAVTDTTHISLADLDHRLLDEAEIFVDVFNWSTPANGTMRLAGGYVTDVGWDNTGRAKITFGGLLERANDITPLTISTECFWDLGDPGCGINIEALSLTGAVTTVNGSRSFNVNFNGGGDPLNNGLVLFESGNNDGYAYHIRDWNEATNRVLLWATPRVAVEVGDDVKIYPGCDKSRGANGCLAYDNFARRLAFPYLVQDEAFIRKPVATALSDAPVSV